MPLFSARLDLLCTALHRPNPPLPLPTCRNLPNCVLQARRDLEEAARHLRTGQRRAERRV
jgi:hypothetical protein